jgi:hypothetical protein
MPPEPGQGGALTASTAGRLASASLFYRTDPAGAWKRKELSSADGFEYKAMIPAAQLSGRWLEYAFQATDKEGRSSRLPEARNGLHTAFFARLTSDTIPPTVEHIAPSSVVPGKPVTLRAKVTDPEGVAAVRAYYRPLADYQPYECIVMDKHGDEYVGTIPGEAVLPEFEFIYFLEAVDEAGNGCFFPDWKTATPYVIVPVQR